MSNNPGQDIIFPINKNIGNTELLQQNWRNYITTTTTPSPQPGGASIMQPSGAYGDFRTAMQSGAVPTFMSSARWSDEARAVPQQTFLGASIRGFNMQGGFGDNSSSLTVDLVVDEYNRSDQTPLGEGDDPYHSGTNGDKFVPPIPGSPVFFKFGPNFATIEEAFHPVFNDIYFSAPTQAPQPSTGGGAASFDAIVSGRVSLPPNSYISFSNNGAIVSYNGIETGPLRGRNHITFGGILQNYNQNRTPQGNPLYSVNVIDPREILSNVTLILNNYAGPTYGQQNVINIYGFLEYNPTEQTINSLPEIKNTLSKTVAINGDISLNGDDKYYRRHPDALNLIRDSIKLAEQSLADAKRRSSELRQSGNILAANQVYSQILSISNNIIALKRNLETTTNSLRPIFPMTGTGFSRRSSQGIPYYRIKDAINALCEVYMDLPQEYKDQGFGGRINFRGYNYVVDFGGLPELPEFHYIDFDEINLLELILEICDITNRDLFVTLLPVIDHPACAHLYGYNSAATFSNMVAGIIRIDTIDRSEQPLYGSIKRYIDNLALQNIYVENQDLGYELSNVVTDKFIVGAQEVDMYFFSSNADRDNIAFRETGLNGVFPSKPNGYQWRLEASLEQQILPYYGKLGQHAVTIPKGFGSYQQILLDATNLNAAGVGSYYVATEMELRCASISFDRWKEFLRQYNDTYMESLETNDAAEIFLASQTPAPRNGIPLNTEISNTYGVTVPRSVFDTYATTPFDSNGFPSSPCNPPYGYPLYYKRMTQIGIPEAGLTDLFNRWSSLNTNVTQLKFANRQNAGALMNSEFQRLRSLKNTQGLTPFENQYFDTLSAAMRGGDQNIANTVALLENVVKNNGKNVFPILPALAKKNNANALKVYNFVKSVADECLGKKFLVKIPREVNVYYENLIEQNGDTGAYTAGPFGFRPRSTRNIPGYEFTEAFKASYRSLRNDSNMMQSFLSPAVPPNPEGFVGALRINYNPLSEKYESNYTPLNVGGYFHFDLYQNTLGTAQIGSMAFNMLPIGVQQGLIPQDMTNFLNEDGRVFPYVRFDHSEDLSLEGFNEGDFTQQLIVGNYMIPDLIQSLDNTGPDNFNAFPTFDNDQQSTQRNYSQIAFVKCSVDEQLYMPPPVIQRSVDVYGGSVVDRGQFSMPSQVYVPCSGLENGQFVPGTGVWVDSISYYKANYIPLPNPQSSVSILDFDRYIPASRMTGGTMLNNTYLVDTDLDRLNTDHAYALITLPNKIVPVKDARFRDGMNQTMTAAKFKHLMTMDVVRVPEFEIPGIINKAPQGNLDFGNLASQDNRIRAWLVMKKIQKQLSFGLPQQVDAVAPSPVYPDLVALPLVSNDRCYGPWISSQLDGQANILSNIGGRVEFIKDENLSPWNYGGYYLLNEAGRLQAEFSNSLLLFSERGSFTIPTIPQGNSLCKSLTIGGPLVTSINLDVSTGGVRTTYQMDLYTASFGKLQKQKQEEISKISRQRKKLNSERNALIRKGLGKNQSGRNFNQEYTNLANTRGSPLNQTALNTIAATVNMQTRNTHSPSLNVFGSNGQQQQSSLKISEYNSVASIQNESTLANTAQMFVDNLDLAGTYYKSASASIDQIFAPYSNGYHSIMSYRPNMTVNASQSLLHIDDEELSLDGGQGVTIQYGGPIS